MARLIDTYVGHGEIVQNLLSVRAQGQLPHSLLFVGPNGVGKKTLALALAQALVCEKENAPCGICGPCLRIEKQQSESLLVISPEKNQIRVDEAHKILEFLNLQAIGRARAIIIDHAEMMNPQSANSLLKILEEPPPNTHFFLTAPSAVNVLITLRSRSQTIKFGRLLPEEMAQKSNEPEWMIKASLGSFERLGDLSTNEGQEIREIAWRLFMSWCQNPYGYLDELVKENLKDRGTTIEVLRWMYLICRDALCMSTNEADKIINQDKLQWLEKTLEKVPVEVIIKASEKLFAMEQSLLQNRDTSLVFEEFWLQTRNGSL